MLSIKRKEAIEESFNELLALFGDKSQEIIDGLA